VLPPPDEQAAIVRFLDHANRKIDGFIRAKRKLIGLLNEQKQAIIHRAVTRGLDPDVPLKPSGAPWLGDIPAHWEVRAFARISRVVRGSSPRPAGDKRFFNGDFMPWVTVGEVTKDRDMYLKSTETFLTQMGAERSTMFPAGTLILTNSGATLGVPKILELNACANDGIVAFLGIRPLIQKPFAYLFLSTLTQRLRDEMRQGGTQPNLNTGIVRRIVCPVPPIAEQDAILLYVERESDPLNTAITRTEREIALMQEYRTRLTADIVTGKLDVREAAAKLHDLTTDPVGEAITDEALDDAETDDAEG
jgi:type I restriction enzyme S subunit